MLKVGGGGGRRLLWRRLQRWPTPFIISRAGHAVHTLPVSRRSDGPRGRQINNTHGGVIGFRLRTGPWVRVFGYQSDGESFFISHRSVICIRQIAVIDGVQPYIEITGTDGQRWPQEYMYGYVRDGGHVRSG